MIRMLKRLSCAGTRQGWDQQGPGGQLARCHDGDDSPWLPDATEENGKKSFQMPFTEKQLSFEMNNDEDI